MNSGRRYQRHTIDVYLRARFAGLSDARVEAAIDRIVDYLDRMQITPERFRGFSFPATRNAIETALHETQE